MDNKNSGKSGELTQNEKLILEKVGLGIVTAKKLCLSTGLKKSRVYEILKGLRQKGLLRKGMEKTEPTIPLKPGNYFRLHGADFNIGILYQDGRYEKIRDGKNRIIEWVGGHKIIHFKNTIEVYGKCSFEAESLQKAFYDSLKYWDKLLCKLEAEYKVMLVKPRSQNISCVMLHYAEVNNGIAAEVHKEHDKLKIYGSDDGKLWCLADFSNKKKELETVHKETGKQDMEVCQRYLNDWRDNEPLTNSEIVSDIKRLEEITGKLSAVLSKLAESQLITSKQVSVVAKGIEALALIMKQKEGVVQNNIEGDDECEERPRYIG